MKPKSTLRSFLCIATSALLTITYSQAATIYWDGTSASWNTNTNWSTASGADTPDPVNFPGSLDDAIFNITTANGAESITLDANQAAKSMTFDNTGITTLLGGGTARTLTLGTGGITLGASAGAVTLGDGAAGNNVLINLTSGTRTWTNNSAASLTINNSAASFTRATGATLGFNKLGAGDFAVTSGVSNDATGIIGPWAFFGTGGSMLYATVNAGTIGGLTGAAAADANAFASATTNYDLTSAAITLTGNRTANTFRSAGAGGIIDLGASGANTLTANGILAVGSGTLSINRTGGTGTVVIGASNELVIAGSQAVTIGAPISGASKTLTYSGTSTLALTGTNTWTGNLNVNSGILNASVSTANTYNIPTTVAAGATYNYNTASGINPTITTAWTINGAFSKPNTGQFTLSSTATLSGSGTFTLAGQNSVAFNGDNSAFTGTITDNTQAGSNTSTGINHVGALGSGTFDFGTSNSPILTTLIGGLVNANVTAFRFSGDKTFSGSNNMSFGTGAVTLTGNRILTINAPLVTFGGAIVESGGTRTLGKAGSGTLVLSGSASNTYGGLTSVTAGTLQLNKSGTANAIAGGGLSVGSGTTVTYTGASTDMIANAAPVTVTGTGVLNLNGVSDTIGTLGLTAVAGNNALVTTGAGILTLGGNVTFTAATTGQAQISGLLDLGAATRTFTVGAGTGAGHDLLINAAITGSVGLTKTGTGRMILSSINSYTGLTTVTDGTLRMTTPSSLANGGLTVAAAKSFIYAPTAAGALDLGSGTITLNGGAAFGTAIGGSLSQSAITSAGAASLTGTGTINIHAVPGSTPAVGTHNLVTAASGLTGGTYTLGAVFNNTNFTLSNFTRTAGAISVDVTAAAALSGNVFWKGGLAGSTGVWSASNGSNQSNWQVTDTVNQPIAPGSTTDLVFSATTSPGTMVGMSLGANVTIRSLTINNTATAFGLGGTDGTLTIGTGGITIGAGVLASSISVPVVLGAAQTWTNSGGTLTVTGGLNNGGNLLTIAGSANIIFGNTTNFITGSGGLTKNGTGTLELSGAGTQPAHNYSGTTTINGGVVRINNGNNSTGTGNLTLNGGVLETNFSGSYTRALGSGVGQLQITGGASGFSGQGGTSTTYNIGGSAATLQFDSTFFAPTTLVLQAATANADGKMTLTNGLNLFGATRTIAVNGSTTTTGTNGATISGVISNSIGTAGLTKTGVGQLLLSATNTFNGTTTISGGILNLTNAAALQNSALDTTNSVTGGAAVGLRTTQTTLTLGGLIGNKDFDDTAGSVFTTTSSGYGVVAALTLNPATGESHSYSGAIGNGASTTSLTKSGAGTQMFTGTNSYSSTTTVSGGTLIGTNATQSFGTNLSGINIQGAGTLSLRNDSSVSFTNGTSAYNIANSASGATINVDRVTGTGTNTITVGNLTTTSNSVTWQLNFTGANGVSLNAGALTTPTAAAGSHTISNNIAGGGALTLSSVAGGGTGVAATLIFNGSANTTVSGAITQAATAQALTKNGAGKLTLNGTNSYTGLTTVSAGTLGGTGSIAGNVTVAAASSLAPGASVGTLSIGGVLNISAQAGGGAGKLNFELGPIAASDKIALTGSGSLTIGGNLLGFSDFVFDGITGLTNGTYKLITSPNAISGGLDPANLSGLIEGGPASGMLQITGNDVELVVSGASAGNPYDSWATSKGLTGANNAQDADPDNDGRNNLGEFAFNGDPLSGSDNGKIFMLTEDSDYVGDPSSAKELILTVAVRTGTLAFTGTPSPSANQAADSLTYSIEGSLDLAGFPTTVHVVPTPILPITPPAGAGYEYRSFSLDGSDGLTGKGFLRAKVTSP